MSTASFSELFRPASLVCTAMIFASCLRPPVPVASSNATVSPAVAAQPAPSSVKPGSGVKSISVPGLPPKIAWNSTGPILVPSSDAKHNLVALKDPTVVRYQDTWHVFASSVGKGGIYNMVYTSFRDWADAPTAKLYYMDQTFGFDTYVAAPQVFYFAPKKTWFLVFQSGPPMYSTTENIADPKSWSPPMPFYSRTPKIIDDNGGWLDFWVICDAKTCHLFFSNDHGRFYKAKTPIEKFPRNFDTPVVVMEDDEAGRLFEACNVYKLKGQDKYLTLIEAFDKSSDNRRYFRSFIADSLEGPWTSVHEDGAGPFAGERNVFFDGAPWTRDISHGELLRSGHDQTLEIDGMDLRYLYQGFQIGAATGDYNAIPWRLGLLTAR